MKTTGVSTAALSQSLRFSLVRAQAQLVKAQREAQTGQVADTGLALGAGAAKAVSFSRDMDRIQSIVDTNGLIKSRLSATKNAMTQLSAGANSFLDTLAVSLTDGSTKTEARTGAQNMLASLTSILNTSFNGEHIFAGINTDVKPVNDFQADGSAAKADFDASFLSHFGFSQDDTQAAGITADQMKTFLETEVEPQFLGSGWETSWSNASDQPIVSRITLTETSETSVSANAEAFRKLAMAATTVSSLTTGTMSEAARQALTEKAISLVGEAISGLTGLQSSTGLAQQRLSEASDRLNTQLDLYERHLGSMLEVDPYEAQTRISNLQTSIETSYALTARLQQLSLLKFIS